MARILAAPGEDVQSNRSKILLRAVEFTWFNSAFTSAGGIDWLAREIASTERHNWMLQLIIQAMTQAESFTESGQWAGCLRKCILKGHTDGLERRLILILHEQSHQRSLPPSGLSNPSDRNSYVRRWSDSEWERWKGDMQELINALRGEITLSQLSALHQES